MIDDENFDEYLRDEMKQGRGHTMWPDFDKIKTTVNIFHFLWDEGFINEGEFTPETTLDEVNSAVESEFGIKGYFIDDEDIDTGIDDMLNNIINFAESYAR